MFPMATVLVVFKSVSVILRVLEKLLMKMMAAGNMRKAMMT